MASVLITTSVDPCRSPHTRLHEMIRALARDNEVAVISVRETQRNLLPDSGRYEDSSAVYLKGVNEIHLTDETFPMSLQETMASWLVRRIKSELSSPDIIVDYNTFFLGLSLQRTLQRDISDRRLERLYDLADYLPDLVLRAIPPIPGLVPLASTVSRLALKRTVRLADGISTTLPSLATEFGADRKKILHVPNGVDISMFKPNSAEVARSRIGVPPEKPLIGYVGTLREWVNLDVVLEALSRIDLDEDRLPLLMVAGREGAFDRMKEYARALGLKSSLRAVGTIPYHEVPGFLSACDLTVVPFKHNRVGNFAVPLKILEAFASGTPVACPGLNGILETFGDVIIRCDSVEDYVRVFTELTVDRNSLRRKGLAGRRVVEDRYDWKSVLEPFLRHLEDRCS